jgi:hypothetical protein
VVQFAELVAEVVHDALTILLARNDRSDFIDLRVNIAKRASSASLVRRMRLVREKFVGYPLAPPHSRKRAYEGAHLSPRMA